MDDPLFVGRVEGLGYLARNRERLGYWQRPTQKSIGKRRSFDQLKDERGQAIGFFQPVYRADIGMVERGQEARFTRETGATLGVDSEM